MTQYDTIRDATRAEAEMPGRFAKQHRADALQGDKCMGTYKQDGIGKAKNSSPKWINHPIIQVIF